MQSIPKVTKLFNMFEWSVKMKSKVDMTQSVTMHLHFNMMVILHCYSRNKQQWLTSHQDSAAAEIYQMW